MRIEALRDMTKDELVQKREEFKQDLFNLKLRRGLSELDNPLRIRTLRRNIARIETILTEDETGIKKIVDQSGSILDRSEKTETESKK